MHLNQDCHFLPSELTITANHISPNLLDWWFLAVNCLGMAVVICQSISSLANSTDELKIQSGE